MEICANGETRYSAHQLQLNVIFQITYMNYFHMQANIIPLFWFTKCQHKATVSHESCRSADALLPIHLTDLRGHAV